jgi:hypothetical protein
MIALDTDQLLPCHQCGPKAKGYYRITGWQAIPHQLLWIECGLCHINLSNAMPTYIQGQPEPEPSLLRGQRIEEFTTDELIQLHEQLAQSLPDRMDQLSKVDEPKIAELELIEEELDRRR